MRILPNNIKKIYINPFVNDTNELELEVESTNAFVDEVLSDGRISLVGTKDESDVTLCVLIKKYVVQHLTYDANNLAEYSKLRVVVDISLTDKNNIILWTDSDRIVEHIYNDKEMMQKNDALCLEISNEQEAREVIWENLSRNIIKRIIKFFCLIS
jgi:hypothetical protein